MTGVASAIGAAATVAGSAIKAKAAKKAGKKQAAAQEAAAEEKRAALEQIKPLQQPYMDAGAGAINSLVKLNSGDYSGFEDSPDHHFALQQGGRAVDRSAAARGGLNSGNTLIAQQRFGQDLASQHLGAYRNALFQTAGMGQNATNLITDATLGTAGAVGDNLIGAGDARASGIAAAGNAWGSGLQNLGGVLGDKYGNSLIKSVPKPHPNSLFKLNTKLPTNIDLSRAW